jgi:protein-disulfide isomerase
MRGLLLAAAAMAVAGTAAASVAAPSPRQAAPAQRDWTRAVAQTPEGGFRMGNPNAPVKVIEYGSLGCPTCARFAAESSAPLLAEVRSGKVSFEFRNYVLSAPDLAAAVLSRCAGPAAYFRLNEAFFSAQGEWLGRVQAASEARMAEIAKLAPEQQLAPLASIAGLDAIAAQSGVAPARAKQCLADPATVERLVAMRRAAWASYRVAGTPTFIVNGQKVHAHAWSELAPLLRPPGG